MSTRSAPSREPTGPVKKRKIAAPSNSPAVARPPIRMPRVDNPIPNQPPANEAPARVQEPQRQPQPQATSSGDVQPIALTRPLNTKLSMSTHQGRPNTISGRGRPRAPDRFPRNTPTHTPVKRAPRMPIYNADGSRNQFKDAGSTVLPASMARSTLPRDPHLNNKQSFTPIPDKTKYVSAKVVVDDDEPWDTSKPLMSTIRQQVMRRKAARKQFATKTPITPARKTHDQTRRITTHNAPELEAEGREFRRAHDNDEGSPPRPQGLQQPSSNTPSATLVGLLEERVMFCERLRRHRHLPFLRRNLVEGFRSRVRRHHASATKAEECLGFTVEYSLVRDGVAVRGHRPFVGKAWAWCCPLCNVFGTFRSRNELKIHLAFAHTDFEWSWTKTDDDELCLCIAVDEQPPLYESESESDVGDAVLSSSDEEVQELTATFTRAARVSMLPPPFKPDALDVDEDMEDVKPYIRGTSVAHTMLPFTSPVKPGPTPHRPTPAPPERAPPTPYQPTPAPPSPSPPPRLSATPAPQAGPSNPPTPVPPRQIATPHPTRPPRPADAPHPPVFLSSSPSHRLPHRANPVVRRGRGRAIIRTPSTSRSPTADATTAPSGSGIPTLPSPHRYPTPPPFSDLTGPSATYPYLSPPEYSARPCGPHLYDLLNSLPLEPFGLMAWYIIDQEESIFEFNDVRDEDKVMQALWLRWILLNRLKFIENYLMGAKAFIDEYWLMIHRAAGFSALRVWLLMLVSNKFLTGTEFCDLLKYYGNIVGMEHWENAASRLGV